MLCSLFRARVSLLLQPYKCLSYPPVTFFLSRLQYSVVAMASNPKDQAYLDKVIHKRIDLFVQLQKQQKDRLQSLPADPIKIVLPDGSAKEGKKWVTSPMDIAREISKGLAANALIAKVNGDLWDMNRPLEGDCRLSIHKFEDE